jgi:hypothetical protein
VARVRAPGLVGPAVDLGFVNDGARGFVSAAGPVEGRRPAWFVARVRKGGGPLVLVERTSLRAGCCRSSPSPSPSSSSCLRLRDLFMAVDVIIVAEVAVEEDAIGLEDSEEERVCPRGTGSLDIACGRAAEVEERVWST